MGSNTLEHTPADASKWDVKPSSRSGKIITKLFFAGLFLDYYGGFGIKYAVFVLAFLWVLQNKSSIRIIGDRMADFIVILLIPLLFIIIHTPENYFFSSENVDLMKFIGRSYNTISVAAWFLLYPLFISVGSNFIYKQMIVGFRAVAIIVSILFVLNLINVIDVRQFEDFTTEYKVGVFSPDVRVVDDFVESNQKVEIRPFVAHAMILMLGFELLRSPFFTALYFIALLILGQRGLIMGGVFVFLFVTVFSTASSFRSILKKYFLFILLLGAAIALFEPIRYRITGVFLSRTTELINVEDGSTLVRFGHIDGYLTLLQNNPIIAFIGAGPMGEIYNNFIGTKIQVMEMAIMNTALWFGIPYAMLYLFWLYKSAYKLWKLRKAPLFVKNDIALIFGAMVFWVTGNTNPLLNTPFSIIAFMLITLRIYEITDVVSAQVKNTSDTASPFNKE
ncbi:MAG: hypothetical protein WDA22_01380 [Bacteroidota bacterium]